MPIHDDLPSLYAYTRWADGRMLEAAGKLTPEDYAKVPTPGWTSVQATLYHLAGAITIWARRLSGESVNEWPAEDQYRTLDDAGRILREGHDAFDRLIGALRPEQLAAVWTYRNLKGQVYSAPLWAYYRHVANHATYHRGQVASKLRLLGIEPPVTDFVMWAIEQTPQA
jgi:uncharacterized damage-inducible protein DinB